MEDYTYLSNLTPIKNASVLFAFTHGFANNSLFNNIRDVIINSFMDEEVILNMYDELTFYDDNPEILEQLTKLRFSKTPMVELAMNDIKKFIYTKVLFSPMARTNSFAFTNHEIIDSHLKYGFHQYNLLNNITSSKLKVQFNNIRKYNSESANELDLITYDNRLKYFQSYNIPKLHSTTKLNKKFLIKMKGPDAMFLKNKVDNNYIVNASQLVKENNKTLLQLPIIKHSHSNDKFMRWVKEQLSDNPKIIKQNYSIPDGITSIHILKKYYDDTYNIKEIQDLRYNIYEYIKFNNEHIENRIIEYHNWKQGHYMYDGILNEKTPDQNYVFSLDRDKNTIGIHRLLYLKDGKKHTNNATKTRPKHLNQLYCSLPKSNKQSLIEPIDTVPLSYEETLSFIKETLHYHICKNINEQQSVPLSWIIVHAWADNMEHLTIFSVACRKHKADDVYINDDPLRRMSSIKINQSDNIHPIKQSLKQHLENKLIFNKHKHQNSSIKFKSSKKTLKRCSQGLVLNSKTNKCRKKCLPEQIQNNKGNCVKNKKLLTKKCPYEKELNLNTNRCRKKCEITKIRNNKGNCVKNN